MSPGVYGGGVGPQPGATPGPRPASSLESCRKVGGWGGPPHTASSGPQRTGGGHLYGHSRANCGLISVGGKGVIFL